MPLDHGTRLGRYELIVLIGSGGMGEVYRARDTRLNRDVAVKVLQAGVADDLTRRARFLREAELISRLNHPNICAIFDAGEHNGLTYLVMEYVVGESLEQRLVAGALPWRTAVEFGAQIAAAIDAAHSHGIVHRDLKPANVMLAQSGVKLLDFGIAKLLRPPTDGGSVAPTQSLTSEHKIVGTLNYMAPEQLEGREIDARADVFALGAVLYEMLTGRKAFEGSSTAGVTAAILTTAPAPVVESGEQQVIPAALEHVVRRALAKDRNARWQTARDVMHELEWIRDGGSRETARRAQPTARPPRRVALALAAGAMALAAIAAAIGWLVRSVPDPPLTTFTIEAPPGTSLGPGYGILSVSPDGLKVAFIASTNGIQSIWVRYLNDLNSKQLLGTDTANSPVWSPNSETLAFYAGGGRSIKRINVNGGQPSTIVDLQNLGPLSNTYAEWWMPDDTIVFPEGPKLYRVPATGGRAVEVAAPSEARGEKSFQLPTSIGNGEFLYLVRGGTAELRETQIGGRTGPRATLKVQSNAQFVAGYLIFRQDTALVAQSFDARHGELLKKPVLLADSVDWNPGNARSVFSASPDVLVYRADAPRQLIWIDRAGQRLGSVGDIGRDSNPAVSHDGLSVAFDRFDPANPRFHVLTLRQGQAVALTHGVTDRFPVWSWDGKWIVYLSADLGGAEIRRIPASGAGGGERLSVDGAERAVPFDISSDGNFLIYERGGDIFALSIKDQTSQQLTSGATADRTGRLSTDMKWFAYTVIDQRKRSVWVQSFPAGGDAQQVSSDAFDPSWRADGRELYYMTSTGNLKAVSFQGASAPRVGPPVTLFSIEPGAIQTPTHIFGVTPDGQRFLVSEPVPRDSPFIVVEHWQTLVR
jgi:eukaryotic-like serine/threonine-protein kinase